MSNVFSLADAAKARKEFEERRNELEGALHNQTQVYIDYHKNLAKGFYANDWNPTMGLIHEGAYEGLTFEPSRAGMLTFGNCLEPNVNIVNKETQSIVECLELVNYYEGPDLPRGTQTVLAVGTKEGIQTLADYDVDKELKDSPTINIADEKEVLGVIYNYIYCHPDVDTTRDSATLSVIFYAMVKHLVNKGGYFLTKMSYTTIRQEELNRNMPSELVLEFTQTTSEKLAKTIYLVIDIEASYVAVEAMFYQLYGVDAKELKEIVSEKPKGEIK